MDETRIQQAKARFGIIGNAPALTRAIGRALRVAPIDLSVLVIGESGAGKEFFPRIIHHNSSRKHANYIAVNCGAIPEGTIDSELFGHEKGAFTGAISSRKGYFEEADGGTIFLDEVAELPLTTQARLLRVLETGEFLKVGSSEVQKTNIRVVAATNVDMAKAIADGRFREDLFYRLSTVQINIPPLRDRGKDIMLLTRKFSTDFADKNSTPLITFTDDARSKMLSYHWPGNVRQLKNVVEQISLFEAGNEISSETLKEYLPDIDDVTLPISRAAAATNLPVVTTRTNSDHTYEREREMLFSLIFKMKKDIEEMREELDRLTKRPEVVEQSLPRIKSKASVNVMSDRFYNNSDDIFSAPSNRYSNDQDMSEEAMIMDTIAEELDPASANLSERETIRLSLERNAGRRKATANELKISERTLYRKIKEYGLE